MVFYLVKHPETMRNVEDKLTGWEESEYSKLGRVQFEKIVNYFSDNDSVVYSSDLSRAKMLAEKIVGNNDSELILDVDLRELNFKETAPHDSCETFDDLDRRVVNFLKGVTSDAIIVSHAGTTNAIVENLCGKASLNNVRHLPRDVILRIENVKNENKLSIIQI
jgi:broad specificity phosphatase PhoE